MPCHANTLWVDGALTVATAETVLILPMGRHWVVLAIRHAMPSRTTISLM
ncbi:MAG TPA: hypothetical protein VGG64_10620 [Pirellulales bacterium]